MIPLALQILFLLLVGACLGSLVNWATYRLAWRPWPISPWSLPADGAPRHRLDRVPVVGWLALRREAHLHGWGFWIRPMFIELGLGVAVAALYWWEIAQLGLVRGQAQLDTGMISPTWPLYWQFTSHVLLLCLMLVASFIDLDEKIIPDEITVTGTLVGLVLVAAVPMSLLPHVAEQAAPPVVGKAIRDVAGGHVIGQHGGLLWLEPVTPVSPNRWPPVWGDPRDWRALAVGLACYWLWCFALAPRIWRGRRGATIALRLIAARVRRELFRPPLSVIAAIGTAGILVIWVVAARWPDHAAAAWAGLLTALVGLAASGGVIWAVRLVGTAALRREAMGFGDVTLMMMIGTFLGWQACLVVFFMAPFAGLFGGIAQLVFRRDQEIPYGPYLCLGAAAVVVFWAPIWNWAQPLFAVGGLVPLVLVVGLALLGVMLAIWRAIKMAVFGESN